MQQNAYDDQSASHSLPRLGRVAEAELLEKRSLQTTYRADEYATDDVKFRNEAAAHAARTAQHAEAEQL